MVAPDDFIPCVENSPRFGLSSQGVIDTVAQQFPCFLNPKAFASSISV